MYLQIGSPAGIRRGPGPLPRPAVSSCFLRTASTPSFPQQTNRNRSGTCSSSIVTHPCRFVCGTHIRVVHCIGLQLVKEFKSSAPNLPPP